MFSIRLIKSATKINKYEIKQKVEIKLVLFELVAENYINLQILNKFIFSESQFRCLVLY